MKIKMRTCLAGPEVVYKPGAEYDVEDAFGDALVADGRAVAVEAEQPAKPKRRERQSRKPAAPNVETR